MKKFRVSCLVPRETPSALNRSRLHWVHGEFKTPKGCQVFINQQRRLGIFETRVEQRGKRERG